MKRLFSHLAFITTVALLLHASCKKVEERAVLQQPAAPVLTASSADVVLDSTHDADNAVTFSWPETDYGYNADVTYTLQFDLPDDDFQSPANVVLSINALNKSYTVKDLNVLAYQTLGLAPNVASDVAVRLKADINQNGVSTGPSSVPTVYSDPVSISITPYKIVIVFPTLWVPGDYQGWTPATAPTIASVKSNNVYEGYVYFPPGGTFQFKYTPAPTWDVSYGWVSSTANGNSVTGTMSTSGGNLFVPAAGYYLLKADLNPTPNTWAATQTTWAIIGDATPGGWDADTPLSFDAATNTWSVTADLVNTGHLKFRANGAWDINLGDDNADGSLEYNGADIALPAAGSGNYTVTLDLSSSGNYTYHLKKN